MRRSSSRGAMLGAFFFTLAGCQETLCTSYVELESEQVCAAFLATFPNGTCLSTAPRDGGSIIFPDSGMKHDGSMAHMDAKGSGQDVFQRHDGFVGSDAGDSSFPVDAGQDSSMPDPLNGSWSLTDAQCDGASLGINGMVTLTFSGSTVTETDNLSDGCVVTTTLSPATVTATDITATAGTLGCGVECTTDDSCAPGDTGTVDEPYTLSGGVLTITLPDDTGTCSTGSIQYLWTQL